MCNLIIKEIRELFTSAVGGVIGVLFIGTVYLFLWIIPGSMNLMEQGYATFDGFSQIVYNLLFITIPLWAMNTYAVEQRYATFDWIRSLPISETKQYVSKFLAAWFGFGILIAITMTVFLPIILITNKPIDIDWGVVMISYLGIMMLSAYTLSMNLFISSKLSNPIASVLISMFANFVLFYGITIARQWLGSGWISDGLTYLDSSYYYHDLTRGVLDSRAIIFFISSLLFWIVVSSFSSKHKRHLKISLIWIGGWIAINIFQVFFFARIDCTQEQLYSITPQTNTIIKRIDRPTQITLYLGGELNASFKRLEQATRDLLLEYRTISNLLNLQQIDPTTLPNFDTSALYKQWIEIGLHGVAVKETTSNGSYKQKLVYPYLELNDGKKTVTINLLSNDPSKSGAENINSSIEQLEYVITEGLSQLLQKEIKKIAFIEGHGEWDEPNIDATLELLSAYYTIDRGRLEGSIEPLLEYKTLIIADPKSSLSAQNIFLLDQYTQRGGSILWSVSPSDIAPTNPTSSNDLTSTTRELGLNELFFMYGIRLKNNLLMDVQCSPIPLKVGEGADVDLTPWYYSPLLKPNPKISFLSSIAWVELPFCSTIELLDRSNNQFSVSPLLQSSSLSRECPLPHYISLKHVTIEPTASNFTQSTLPAAVLIEGIIPSLYANRLSPIDQSPVTKVTNPKQTKIVVVASGELLKNKITLSNDGKSKSYPLGFNPYMSEPTGNSDFVVNTVKYLCGDNDLIGVTRKQFRLRLLSKTKIEEHKSLIHTIALISPLLLLGSLNLILLLRRKRRYNRPLN